MERRTFLAALASPVVAGLPPVSPMGESPSASVSIDRYFRIVVIAPDGSEEVVEHCLCERRANAYSRIFNALEHLHGCQAEAREIDVASIRTIAESRRLRRKAVRS
jgi:hypothetical protein